MDEKASCTPPRGFKKTLKKCSKMGIYEQYMVFVNFVSQNGPKHQARVDCVAFFGTGFSKTRCYGALFWDRGDFKMEKVDFPL